MSRPVPSTTALASEAAARRVLLLRAFESGADDSPLWTAEDARWATRVARETVPASASAGQFLDERSQHALQRLQARDAGIPRLLARRGWRWWWLAVALLLGLVMGISMDIFGGGQHISLLAPAVWAVVLWNLIVYAGLLVPRPHSLPSWLASRLAGRRGTLPARLQFQQAWARQAAPQRLATP